MQVIRPEDIITAKRLIFPGVGAFKSAMEVLNAKGCVPATLLLHVDEIFSFLHKCDLQFVFIIFSFELVTRLDRV